MASKIILIDKGKIVSNDSDLANIFDNFYQNTVKELHPKCDDSFISDTSHLNDPVEIAIEKFKNHSSIKLTRDNVDAQETQFEFQRIEDDVLLKKIQNLDPKKSNTFNGILAKCLQATLEVSGNFLTKVWNEEIVMSGLFPDDLKLADATLEK